MTCQVQQREAPALGLMLCLEGTINAPFTFPLVISNGYVLVNRYSFT
jgi:hypothetical protein